MYYEDVTDFTYDYIEFLYSSATIHLDQIYYCGEED